MLGNIQTEGRIFDFFPKSSTRPNHPLTSNSLKTLTVKKLDNSGMHQICYPAQNVFIESPPIVRKAYQTNVLKIKQKRKQHTTTFKAMEYKKK